MFVNFNNDQRREVINTRQRHQAWLNAVERERGYRGSLVWEDSKGRDYLLKSFYDEHGKRRQKSLGKRSPETEAIKAAFDSQRAEAIASRKVMDEALERQAAVNRALGLGRVPLVAARILRLLDRRGLLGRGIRVVGTNALYAYEAACGVFIDPQVTATEDIDLLFDARMSLKLVADTEITSDSLVQLLKLADRSFRKTPQPFRAQNDEGYLVDLIKPVPKPPWRSEKEALGASTEDIQAVGIEGLVWLQNAASFPQVAIDDRGYPLRIEAVDPRAFAVHKFWLSTRPDRDAIKKERDRTQAFVVAELTTSLLPHLPLEASALRMLPGDVVTKALAAFATNPFAGSSNSNLRTPS